MTIRDSLEFLGKKIRNENLVPVLQIINPTFIVKIIKNLHADSVSIIFALMGSVTSLKLKYVG